MNFHDKKMSLEALAEPLSCIPSDDYTIWRDVGMALHAASGGGEDGFTIWDTWSRSSEKYNAAVQRKRWNGFKPKEGGKTAGTIIHLAREHGWRGGDTRHASTSKVERKPETVTPYSLMEARLMAEGYTKVATYAYGDAGWKDRWKHPTQRKRFEWYHADENGELMLRRRRDVKIPPYGLERALEHADQMIFVAEGEKCADLLNDLDLVAIHIEDGHYQTAAEMLSGRKFVVLPDNDEPGELKARKAFAALQKAGEATMLRLPDLAELGDDIEQWLAIPGNTVSRLQELVGDEKVQDSNARLKFCFSEPRARSTSTRADYNVKHVIPSTGTGILLGASGLGKSFVSIDLSAAVARGIDWCGRRTKQGQVAYFAVEGGFEIMRRFDAYMREHNLEQLSVKISSAGLNLLEPANVEAAIADLKVMAASSPIRLVVIDTLAAACPGGDLNGPQHSSMATEALKRIAREVNCFVLAIAHPSKADDKNPAGNMRFRNDIDVLMVITPNEDERTILIDKNRDGPDKVPLATYKLETVDLGIDDEGDEITSAIVRWCREARQRQQRVPPAQRALIEHINQVGIEGGGTRYRNREGFPDNVPCVDEDAVIARALRARDVTSSADDKVARQSVRNALTKMKQANLIGGFDKKLWVISR